jgi:CBS domain-containing protein
MPSTVAEHMTAKPVTIDARESVRHAAELMRARDIGDVIVTDSGKVVGLVTDRDLVVRVLATGDSPEAEVRTACSGDLVTVGPDDDVERAEHLMREKAVRRAPVMKGKELVGIVSIGDLAIDLDRRSALADISASEPNT